MSTVVLTCFTASDAYKTDRSVANGGMELLNTVDGVLGHYHGVATHDENLAYQVGLAASPEVFKGVVTNPELFDSITKKFEITRVGEFKLYHAIVISDPKKALRGPLTEVCVFSLKDPTPENRQTIEKLAKEFNEITEGTWTFGWTGEDSNKAIVLASWDSVEAHQERAKDPEVADRLKVYLSLINTDEGPAYVKMTKF